MITTRDQQPLTGIRLVEVPYTGFEAGPALTALFYTLLTLWAFFIAYVLIVKEGSVFGFTLKGRATEETVTAEEEFRKKVQQLAAKYSHRPTDQW